jgi:uracil-DNA glycosylase family 4
MTTEHPTDSAFLPARLTRTSMERAARACTGCDLQDLGTQTVFGEGPVPAALMLIGEQPGDREDRKGRPFVGPSGALLYGALTEAGVDPDEVYLTNAVKHCPVGGHAREAPAPSEAVDGPDRRLPAVAGREISIVRPEILVCLGAMAAQAILGRSFRLTRHRGSCSMPRRCNRGSSRPCIRPRSCAQPMIELARSSARRSSTTSRARRALGARCTRTTAADDAYDGRRPGTRSQDAKLRDQAVVAGTRR